MGAQEHTRLVQQVYESFRARDVTSLMNALGPGIEWQLPEMENLAVRMEIVRGNS